ncbi:hypothetical protein [Flavobacterium collinsii]|uniref:HTH merR-type domain-containing protein n=1 Tax=Flavobacterium collinsii TaxID=1114861 RepID=A0ABM8KDU0_9FLAO|nr:hypothetical protein [Flavobacterium collinsii]CAA9195054.1 hypothetical protein FLACOL7796_00416 [Flavobacterium collinsii]
MVTNLLTRIEAIEYLKIGSTTFRKYEKAGLIKPMKAGKQNVTNRKRYNPIQLDRVWL